MIWLSKMVLGRVHKAPNIFSLLGPGDLITVQAGEHLSTRILATRLVEVHQTIFAWDAYTESDNAVRKQWSGHARLHVPYMRYFAGEGIGEYGLVQTYSTVKYW